MPALQRRWFAWIAAMAILLGALVPTVSRGLAASRSAALPMMEICVTGAGAPSRLVFRQLPDDASGKMMMDHCPLCVMHADGHGLPPNDISGALATAFQHEVPTLFLHAPTPMHVWASPLARAPPRALA